MYSTDRIYQNYGPNVKPNNIMDLKLGRTTL